MTDEIKWQQQWTLCMVSDNFSLVQGAPTVTDPLAGTRVDPTGVFLVYGWCGDGWFLQAAEVHGTELRPDGTYVDGPEAVADFFDPVEGEEGAGKAPDWIIEKAKERMAQLPAPSPLPEGWRFSSE